MGFFKSVGKALGSAGKTFAKGAGNVLKGFGGLASGFGIPIPRMPAGLSAAMPHLGTLATGGSQLVQGITGFGQGPSSESPAERGREAGVAQREFLKAAYPGTNPWEHLGTGQGGVQGEIAERAVDVQDRMSRRQVSMQREIAQMNAFATVAASATKEYPELARPVLSELAPSGMSAGPNLSDSVSRGKLANERLQIEVNQWANRIRESEVDVQRFRAATDRMLADLQSDRFQREQAIQDFEIAVKNRELAMQTVETFGNAFKSMDGDIWKSWMSRWRDFDGWSKDAIATFFTKSLYQVPHGDIVGPSRIRPRTSAPGPR